MNTELEKRLEELTAEVRRLKLAWMSESARAEELRARLRAIGVSHGVA